MMPFDFDGDFGSETKWHFQNAFTIDPSQADRAWEKLNVDQLGAEFSHLPQKLHFALIDTLKERRSLDRFRWE